ncbi:MAG: hypothetical protein WAN58_11840 [Anaerolineales bacterium]
MAIDARCYCEEKRFFLPEIELSCDNKKCGGKRVFAVSSTEKILSLTPEGTDAFVNYVCKNCEQTTKKFSVHIEFSSDLTGWIAYKYGELPPFGPPTPAGAIKLIGPDRELFLQGRRCENQGMGIGAFVYYRRVVENQKNRIFDEIIKVTKVVSPGDELLTELENAKVETQFSRAVESIKHAIPQSLLINGQNPLLLLHFALSEGVHADDDAQCLELATSIRVAVVLIEFAERLGQALKDEAELADAVKRLTSKRNKNS